MNRKDRRMQQATKRVKARTLTKNHTSFAEFFLGRSMANGRECGGCVACCEVLAIDQPELQKPADELCQHCTGSGCGIWATRPPVCENWYCVWRRISALPDWVRPDKLGVMFEMFTNHTNEFVLKKRYIRGFSLKGIDHFADPRVLEVIEFFKQAPVAVWLEQDNGTMTCVHPSSPICQALLTDTSGQTPEQDAEISRWKEIYSDLH